MFDKKILILVTVKNNKNYLWFWQKIFDFGWKNHHFTGENM